MTDWEKLKVTDLKDELKTRGIPLTGLKLKQHFIDKLNELDSNTEAGDAENTDEAENKKIGEGDANDYSESSRQDDGHGTLASNNSFQKNENNIHERRISSSQVNSTEATPTVVDGSGKELIDLEAICSKNDTTEPSCEIPSQSDRMDKLPKDLPAELKKEESLARDAPTPPSVEAETATEEMIYSKDDPFIPQRTSDSQEDDMAIDAPDTVGDAQIVSQEQELQSQQSTNENILTNESNERTAIQPRSPPVSSPERLEGGGKRKRSSATLTPEVADYVHKKVKATDGTSIPTTAESEALKEIQKVTDEAQAIRNPDLRDSRSKSKSTEHTLDWAVKVQDDTSPHEAGKPHHPDIQEPHQHPASPSRRSSDRDISPAIHSATASLYIRNFKRPLHIPTLRAYISELAGSPDGDPIRLFYLDSIRTHAFVSFASISAASRVRNSMHATRFPDEPMREALWIDFIPDEKVQDWIDQESGTGGSGFGGGRGSSKKYEIVYKSGKHGIEASLHEVSSSSVLPQRPGVQQSRSNRMVTQDRAAVAAVVSGIHPSRASLVPQSPTSARIRDVRQQTPPRSSDPGKGFRALDELFSSTTAKPKLYYKLPPQVQIDDRLDMMRDLRVNHDEMGQSGDEGMKRYTFEKDERSGRDEWVDKGPEFGFGKRGQDRLTGFGTTYGRGRGRGGFRGSRRGGDSWRGG